MTSSLSLIRSRVQRHVQVRNHGRGYRICACQNLCPRPCWYPSPRRKVKKSYVRVRVRFDSFLWQGYFVVITLIIFQSNNIKGLKQKNRRLGNLLVCNLEKPGESVPTLHFLIQKWRQKGPIFSYQTKHKTSLMVLQRASRTIRLNSERFPVFLHKFSLFGRKL